MEVKMGHSLVFMSDGTSRQCSIGDITTLQFTAKNALVWQELLSEKTGTAALPVTMLTKLKKISQPDSN